MVFMVKGSICLSTIGTDAVGIKAQPRQSGVALEASCYGLVKRTSSAWYTKGKLWTTLKSILYARHKIGLLVLLVLFVMNDLAVLKIDSYNLVNARPLDDPNSSGCLGTAVTDPVATKAKFQQSDVVS